MSLDVRLYANQRGSQGSGIFIRENGKIKEISRNEWDAKFPGREPVIAESEGPDSIYHDNITHNLSDMAEAAGIYQALWQPEEIGASKAEQLIAPLRAGLAILTADPDRFAPLNPANGWGDYVGLVEFTSSYLRACEEWPDAEISVSR